jgi:hypothetical protein
MGHNKILEDEQVNDGVEVVEQVERYADGVEVVEQVERYADIGKIAEEELVPGALL